MNFAFLQDFGPIGILLLGAAMCAALELRATPGRGQAPGSTRWVALAALLLAFAASVGFWHSSNGPAPPDIEHGSFVIDRFALFFYAAALATAGAVVLCGADSESELEPQQGVFHMLLLVGCAGVLFTASATDLVSIGAGMALAVLPMALAQSLRKTDAESVRIAARALALSGFSLVALLGGMAILAALAKSTNLRAIPAGLPPVGPLLVLAAVLLVLGAGAQLGFFPFMWWRAGAGARLPALPYLGGTLLGALGAGAALLRLLPGALGAAPGVWTPAVAILAGVTLLAGPCLAWRQRRLGPAVTYLLAAQLGLLLATLPQVSQAGTATILYLLLCVVPLGAGLLGLLGSISSQAEGDAISDLRGLWARSPLMAGALILLLASLAGLPPLAGFFVRLMTVAAALHAGLGWLGWLELVSAAISALVVFRWLLTILDARVDGPAIVLPGRSTAIGVGLCVAAVLTFGVLVGPIFAIASRGALPPLVGP